MTVVFRKTILQVHRWTGLTIGLVILMMAITGAVNLYRPSLEPIMNQDLLTVPVCSERVTLDQLAGNARAFHSAGAPDYISLVAAQESEIRMPAARIRFSDPQDDVYLNPCTGRVLGERARYGGLLGSIEQLHILRFSENKIVRSITGVCAIVFAIVLIAGGIFLWWPRQGRIRSALTLDRRLTGRAWHLNLHKTTGAYAAAILMLLVLTGLPLAFDWYREGIYWLAGSPLPAKLPKSQAANGKRISMEAFWQRVQELAPQPEEVLLKFPPVAPNAALEGFAIERGAPHPNARTLFSIDAYSGKPLRFVRYADSNPGHKLYFWTLSFHKGQVGGVPVQMALLAGVLGVPVMAYSGFTSFLRRRRAPVVADRKTLNVRVAALVDEALEVKRFELVEMAGSTLPPFTAGAHINVHMDEGLVRQYSLCNDPAHNDRYVIAVKLAAESRGGSRTMHERVRVGDILVISAPTNHFPLARDAKHHVLMASGIGITPLLAMAHRLTACGDSYELHYFTRSLERTAFHGELSALKFVGRVHFHYAVEPDRLHDTVQRILGRRLEGAHLYLCGSKRFMTLVEDAAASRWPPDTVHTEYFSADPMAFAGERKAFEIVLARSGGTFTVPASKSVVDVLRENTLCGIETSCEQGVCGTCLTGVLEGVPDHRDAFLSDEERRAGQKMLLCVSRAKSERLVLDL